jgi:malonyl CoA-acyl carrier protein transacylase
VSRVVVVCPGRGSYTRKTRGTFEASHPLVQRAEAVRAEYGLPPLLELDAATWSNDVQLRPDNISPLIWLASMIDAHEAARDHDVVAVAGNSMGWYTALAVAGALDFEDGFRLVQEMALLQMEHTAGGQLLFPLVGEDWRLDPERVAAADAALAAAGGEGFPSIRLGGFAVLAGSDRGMEILQKSLPTALLGMGTYPVRLAQHGPYHTPLLEPVARKAAAQLARLDWRRPRKTLVDGTGRRHSPTATDPAALRDYTLGPQITRTFDVTTAVRVALREFAPDRVCLPGPGNTLGSITAQIAILEGWRGLADRASFERLQESDRPLVWSMRR